MIEIINNYPLVRSHFKDFISMEFKVDVNNHPSDEMGFVFFLFFIKNNLLCSTTHYFDDSISMWKNKLICRNTSEVLYEKDNFRDYYPARQDIFQRAGSILEERLYNT